LGHFGQIWLALLMQAQHQLFLLRDLPPRRSDKKFEQFELALHGRVNAGR